MQSSIRAQRQARSGAIPPGERPAHFELTVAPADGPVQLRMTGPPGTREFLEAELPL